MAPEIGKMDKPEATSFKHSRKLFLVPLIYSSKEAPAEYIEKYELYWKQVGEHIENLEAKLGKVNRVYHESITSNDENSLKIMEKLNAKSCQIVKKNTENGAKIEIIEERQLAEECMDWERCLLVGLLSEAAIKKVSELYIEAARKRYQHISQRIDKTLKADEIAVLFIREGSSVQFPKDIEVFSVAPPALDEIHRWLRSRPSPKEVENDSSSSGESGTG
jgi:type II secretory ATPase GspE/PulE/Tfp pilus assembly ATPase PilB-like protein